MVLTKTIAVPACCTKAHPSHYIIISAKPNPNYPHRTPLISVITGLGFLAPLQPRGGDGPGRSPVHRPAHPQQRQGQRGDGGLEVHRDGAGPPLPAALHPHLLRGLGRHHPPRPESVRHAGADRRQVHDHRRLSGRDTDNNPMWDEEVIKDPKEAGYQCV